jgi:hypothetical protein
VVLLPKVSVIERPHSYVSEPRSFLAVFRLSNLDTEVAVWIGADRSDGNPVCCGNSGALALFELCFLHAPGAPAGTSQSLVRGSVSFRVSIRPPDPGSFLQPAFRLQKFLCLIQTELPGHSRDTVDFSLELFRDFCSFVRRIHFYECLQNRFWTKIFASWQHVHNQARGGNIARAGFPEGRFSGIHDDQIGSIFDAL